MNIYSIAGMLFGLAIILLVVTFFGWFASGMVSNLNGTWMAAWGKCYDNQWEDPPSMGINTNPFAIITGDYRFDCTRDVVTDSNGTLRVETKVLKTIHVQRGLI